MADNLDAGRFLYKATLMKVVDGDTVDLAVDLGFSVVMDRRFRLFGLNSPETNAKDQAVRDAGNLAKAALLNLISGPSVAGQLRIRSIKDTGDKYGRYLAVLLVVDSTGTEILNVNDALLKGGYAVPYNP